MKNSLKEKPKNSISILIAGGTGGHLFPAFAIAQESVDRGNKVLLITDPRGKRFVSKKYEDLFEDILILEPSHLSSFMSLFRFIQKHRPQSALGLGGKMTIMPLIVARMMGLRCGIHELDRIMGKANSWLSYCVHQTFTGFDEAGPQKAQVIGNPVRKDLYDLGDIDPSFEPFNLVILGGSQGAHFWSSLVPKAIQLLSPELQKKMTIVHQCRPEDHALTQDSYKATQANVSLFPFIEDIPSVLKKAHLVLTRSGASSVTELMAAGRPALFVPYPHACQNHQTHNANYVVAREGGWLFNETELTPQRLAHFLSQCLDNPQQLVYASKRIATLSKPHAAARLVDFLQVDLI